MNLIKKLDAILSNSFPFGVMKDAYKLTQGFEYSDERELNPEEIKQLRSTFNGQLPEYFIDKILPEKYKKYKSIAKSLDVQVEPLDQYQIRKFGKLIEELEKDINQHYEDLANIRKELTRYVFSKIFVILKKDYGLEFNMVKVESSLSHYDFTSTHFTTGTISIAHFTDNLRDSLDSYTVGKFTGIGLYDKVEAIFRSNRFLKLHKDHEKKRIENSRLISTLSIAKEGFKRCANYTINIKAENVSDRYSEWFSEETGNPKAARIAPKELRRKDPNGWTYIVISRSPVDLAEAMDIGEIAFPNHGDMWNTMVLSNKVIEKQSVAGVLIAFECRIDDISKVSSRKPKLTNVVSCVGIYPGVVENDSDSDSDKILIVNNDYEVLKRKSKQKFSMLQELTDYIDKKWNNSRKNPDKTYKIDSESLF